MLRNACLLALLLLPALVTVATAQTAGQPEQRLLTVSGTGEAKAVPDQATISAGVVTEAKTAGDALSANSRAMNAVFATLKRFGIPDKAIQTSNSSVSPQYPDYDSKQPRRIIGYQVSNTVTVTVDDLTKLGPALDALVSSGANSLGDIAFSIHDDKPLLAQAREAAVKDALAKAQMLSRAAGVSLGPIVSIGEEGTAAPVRPMYRMAVAAAPAAPPPVAAGEESLTVNVTISWEIR
jgi:hypothetical protein